MSSPATRHVKKKRGTKRHRRDDEETTSTTKQAEEQLSYCCRLLHQCRKDLHKNAKVCKNFECQKLIRKIKGSSSTTATKNETEGDNSSNNNQKLRAWRELSLDHVLKECFRRLGVLDLLELETQHTSKDSKGNKRNKSNNKRAPKKDSALSEEEEKSAGEVEKTTAAADDDGPDASSIHQRQAIERVLQHKRMREAIECGEFDNVYNSERARWEHVEDNP